MADYIKDIVMMVVSVVLAIVMVSHAMTVGYVTVWAVAIMVSTVTLILCMGTIGSWGHAHMDARGYGYVMHPLHCHVCEEMVRMYHLTDTTCTVCGMGAHPCHATVTYGSMICEHCTYAGYGVEQDMDSCPYPVERL